MGAFELASEMDTMPVTGWANLKWASGGLGRRAGVLRLDGLYKKHILACPLGGRPEYVSPYNLNMTLHLNRKTCLVKKK